MTQTCRHVYIYYIYTYNTYSIISSNFVPASTETHSLTALSQSQRLYDHQHTGTHTYVVCVTHSFHSPLPLFICLNVWEAVEHSGNTVYTVSFSSVHSFLFVPSFLSIIIILPCLLSSFISPPHLQSFILISLSGVFVFLCQHTSVAIDYKSMCVCLHSCSFWSLNKHVCAAFISF